MRIGLPGILLVGLALAGGTNVDPAPASQKTGTDERAVAWLARLKGAVSPREHELLSRAQATLLANIARPDDVYDKETVGGRSPGEAGKPLPWAPLRGIYPSPFKYRGVWSWDGPFHALAVARWDAELAREQLEILFRFQLPDGALPDVIMEDGTIVSDFGKPPVMPWACRRVDELAPDAKFLAAIYPKLVAYEAHWMADRGGRAEGLFHYGGKNPKFESGWDTSVRWDHGCDNLWAVDLNCCMVMLYASMAAMARRLGRNEEQAAWLARARTLGERINQTLWNDRAGAYMDRNRASGEFTGVLSPASFMPLYVKIAGRERAERMAGLAADPAKFFPGMPSVSYDNPAFRSDDYWRGPTWLNADYFALKGLKNFGCDRVADEIRKTILGWCEKNADDLWEYYDSRNGKGLGARQYGWTGTFLMELILDWEGRE
jgi:putative isomerase